jgi:hypothetical protein
MTERLYPTHARWEYVGGGYFRDGNVPVGERSPLMHAPEVLERAEKAEARVKELEKQFKDSDEALDRQLDTLDRICRVHGNPDALAGVEQLAAKLARMSDAWEHCRGCRDCGDGPCCDECLREQHAILAADTPAPVEPPNEEESRDSRLLREHREMRQAIESPAEPVDPPKAKEPRRCSEPGCNRVLGPHYTEHRGDVVPRQQHEAMIAREIEVATARARDWMQQEGWLPPDEVAKRIQEARDEARNSAFDLVVGQLKERLEFQDKINEWADDVYELIHKLKSGGA